MPVAAIDQFVGAQPDCLCGIEIAEDGVGIDHDVDSCRTRAGPPDAGQLFQPLARLWIDQRAALELDHLRDHPPAIVNLTPFPPVDTVAVSLAMVSICDAALKSL
jgi:hypothetical protein